MKALARVLHAPWYKETLNTLFRRAKFRSLQLAIVIGSSLVFLLLSFKVVPSVGALTNGKVCNKSSVDILVLFSQAGPDKNAWISPGDCTNPANQDADAIWGKQCDSITGDCRLQVWKVGPHSLNVIDGHISSVPSRHTLLIEGLCLLGCGWNTPDSWLKPSLDNVGFSLGSGPRLTATYSGQRLVQVAARGLGQVPHCGDLAATIVGTAGDDILHGTAGRDVIVGLAGNDILYGYGGNDRLCGKRGDDKLVGGDGSDWLSGDTGDDELVGGTGDDTLKGGPGDDILDGGSHVFGDDCNRRSPSTSDTILNCETGPNISTLRD